MQQRVDALLDEKNFYLRQIYANFLACLSSDVWRRDVAHRLFASNKAAGGKGTKFVPAKGECVFSRHSQPHHLHLSAGKQPLQPKGTNKFKYLGR
jgi:hypothetical protein